MADLTCDVAVIGAGTAGIAAERNARKHGAKTLLIDPEFAGTVCATVGCMPSKLLIAAVHAAEGARRAARFGVHAGDLLIDGPAVMRRVRKLRDDFAASTRETFDQLPEGTCVEAMARFTGGTSLALDDGRSVAARSVVIATGSAPMVPPPYRDLGDLVLTNRNVFDLPDLPDSLAVIGAGTIGLELAQAFARLGVRVAIFDQDDRIAGLEDDDLHAAVRDVMERDMALHLGTDPQPENAGGKVRIRFDGQEETFDKVLVATGRPPQLGNLDLAATGLALDDDGLPDIDPDTMQCGDAPIFVAGDVSGLRPVLHEASDEGAIAGRNAVAYPAVVRAARKVPFRITFTDPPLVHIGEAPNEDSLTGKSDFSSQGRARVEARNVGLARLHAARPDGCLTGATLFCPGAEHLGHLLAWAIEGQETVGDLLDRPFYHPTLEEGLKDALRGICEGLELPIPGSRDPGDPPGF